MLSRQRVSQLTSRLVPVQAGDEISLSTYVHYSSATDKKTWQKIGAAAAGLAIGSLPYLLDRNKADGERSAGNDLLKKAVPLAGAGVAALPLVLNKQKDKAISKNTNMPKSKNGLFVPDAYLSYTFYDLEGKKITSAVRSIDKHAKDAWQELSLQAEAPQDGYVQVEVGNGSKRPVWMDGMKYSRAREVDFVSEGKKRIANTSIAPDTSTLEFEVDQLMQNNASGYWRCWEICIEQIENYDFNPREEEYCWEECEWVPVTLPSPSQPSPSPDPGDGSGGDDGGGGAGGGNSDDNPDGSPSGTPSAPVPPQNQTPNNQYQAQVIQDRCLGFKRMLELQSQHNKEQIGLLTTDGYVVILPWDGHTKTTSATRNTYDNNGKRVVSFDINDEGLWTVIVRDDSQGKAVFYEYQVWGHVHTHPQDGNHNKPSPDDKDFATSYFGSIPELHILNKHNLVHYDETGKTDQERHGCN